MQRSGRVFCCLVFLVLGRGLDAASAAGQVSDVRFDEPRDGATWHRGDVIRARISFTAPVSGTPVLELVIGEHSREMVGRVFRNGRAAPFTYAVRSDDAAAANHVRMASVKLAGVEVDLSAFNPTSYAVNGNSGGAAPVIDGMGLSAIFGPASGAFRPGDEIVSFVRFHKTVTVSGAPVLVHRVGEEMREARYRPDIPSPPGALYFTYTVQAGDCDRDGVGIPASAIRGGSIREAHGSRPAVTSHPAQDPARDIQAGATRQIACTAVPALPTPGVVVLASLLLAASAHLIRGRRRT